MEQKNIPNTGKERIQHIYIERYMQDGYRENESYYLDIQIQKIKIYKFYFHYIFFYCKSKYFKTKIKLKKVFRAKFLKKV